jgi:2-oxoglutarate ferredoxin oxidoreductase subunit alpha
MSETAINILVGGAAGQGLATIGTLMSKALIRAGYEVVVTQDYQSRVRGGHNTFAIRTGPELIHCGTEAIDILVALNQETIDRHSASLAEGAVVVAGAELKVGAGQHLAVPFKELAPKPMFNNVAALGVLGSTLCGDIAILEGLLASTFGKKGQEVVDANHEVLRRAWGWVRDQHFHFACMPPAPENAPRKMMLNGNEAIALGAMAAGCNFLSFYPMTPSTSVALTLIAKSAETGLVAEQAEDEISAVNMALGASFAGARSIVTTSGGGFALMVEGVSLAGITETPLVFVLVQRPGPATGLPTRTEQGDLFLAVHAGHGDFPRPVFAPGDAEDCFWLTHRAFDLAERTQGPVFVLSDQYLADSYRAVEPFDLDALPEVAAPILEPENPGAYRRYAVTGDGLSPRAVPGYSTALVKADSDEHDEMGHIEESPQNRIIQQDKRMRKEAVALREVVPPTLHGEEGADVMLLCWGSTLGPALAAAEALLKEGTDASVLHFSQVNPLDESQFMHWIEAAGTVVGVEGNPTGQFCRHLAACTGYQVKNLVLRYDGYPLTEAYILQGLKDIF